MMNRIRIEEFRSFAELDKNRFAKLIESGFLGQTLTSNYFSYAKPCAIFIAILDGEYCGAVVVENAFDDIFYLDKFVVSSRRQGLGIGGELWNILLLRFKKLIWRAKINNPVCEFYKKHCDEFIKEGFYVYFWYGISPRFLSKAVEYVDKKKPTLTQKII